MLFLTKKRAFSALLAAAVLTVCLFAVTGCMKKVVPEDPLSGAEPVPTEQPTAEPAEAAPAEFDMGHAVYLDAAQRLLKRESIEDYEPTQAAGEMLFFADEGGKLIAYGLKTLYPDDSTSFSRPFAEYPPEFGAAAREAIAEAVNRDLYHSELNAEEQEAIAEEVWLSGWAGQNWTIIQYRLAMNRQVVCMFTSEDGEEWIFSGDLNPETIDRATGAGQAPNGDLYLCMTEYGEGEKAFYVLKSADGGKSWEDIGLELPKDIAEAAEFCPIYSPVFEGENGVMLCAAYYPGSCEVYAFRTQDGGESWTFEGRVN